MPFVKLLVSNMVMSLLATIVFTKTPFVLNISILPTSSAFRLIVIVFENGLEFNLKFRSEIFIVVL
jgi:hypothetical protein